MKAICPVHGLSVRAFTFEDIARYSPVFSSMYIQLNFYFVSSSRYFVRANTSITGERAGEEAGGGRVTIISCLLKEARFIGFSSNLINSRSDVALPPR